MIAQLQNVDPGHLKDALLIILAFSGVVTPWLMQSIASKRTQRREVIFGDSFMTRELCTLAHGDLIKRVERCEAAIRDAMREFKHDIEKMNTLQEQRAANLHDRINQLTVALTGSVGELRGKVMDL